MKAKKIFIYFLFSLVLTICAPPPLLPEITHINAEEKFKILTKDNNSSLSFRTLIENKPDIQKVNSTFTKIIHDEDNVSIEHTLIIAPINITPDDILGAAYTIEPKEISLDIIFNTCKVESKDKSSTKECKATQIIEDNFVKFIYYYNISYDDKVIIHYKYNKKKNIKQILLIQDSITIPILKFTYFCDYKLIIPDGYINLGLKNNILKKESDKIYSYIGECPNQKSDIIRYSPEESLWKADIGLYLENFPKKKYVDFIFPRYYIGGKLENYDYTIISTENKVYNADDQIFEDLNLKIRVASVNEEKVGVNLHTTFSNKLTNDFNVYLPEKYYEIDLSKIDQVIIDKANEIINDDSDFPNYIKIGKFVNSIISYDENMFGKNLTLREIYYGKKGVCKHKTLLYNAMLNSIGIKTLYIVGYAFQNNQTYGDNSTTGHAWTAALIDGKWKELDATWGLFEGISAGHIFKNFIEDIIHYPHGSSLYQNIFIQMISDDNEINYKEKKVLIIVIIVGIFIFLCSLFLVYRNNKNKRLYSNFIEENIDINGTNENNQNKANQ